MAQTKKTISKLNRIQNLLEKKISYAAITEWENLHHEERDCVVRAVTFNLGTRSSVLVFDTNCEILHYSHIEKRVSRNLLPDIMSVFIEYLVEAEED